jgi:hypothetical protein
MRTYARNRTTIRRRYFTPREGDGQYLLKLVLMVLLGTFWLKFAQPLAVAGMPLAGIPLGMLFGLLITRWFEKNQADRKIWYLVLVVITIICYFVPAGVLI